MGAVPRGGGAGDAPGSGPGLGAGAAGRIPQGSGFCGGSARGVGSGCGSGAGAAGLLLLQDEGVEGAAGTVLDCSWLQDAVQGAAGDEGEGVEGEGEAVHPHRDVGEVQTEPFPDGTSPGGAQAAVPQGGGAHPVGTPDGGDASYAEVGPPGGETYDAVIAYDDAET